ncbi:YncE family protein [Halomonas sp. C05BenzN]|uniref:YncE family protein n=1 Tax=Halomonas sp. C05BenzN TaxID=3411041 RepID=UPI003B92F11F
MNTIARTARHFRCLMAGVAGLGLLLQAGSVLADSDNPYEIWALDQGTHKIHIYDQELREVADIALGDHGVRVPHMIDFTSDGRYAFTANVASGNVAVIRAEDRTVVEIIETGPRTHMVGVRPGDEVAVADIIGAPDVERDGKLVEILLDLENERFERGRELTIIDDPVFQAKAEAFHDVAAICHFDTADGARSFVTLGPALANGGLVVVDNASFTLEKAWGPEELQTNCGTMLTPDGRHMLLNGGGENTGAWHAVDVNTLEIVRQDESSRGIDAHGVRNLPNGQEIWMVNRGTSNGIVIDADTLEVIDTIADTGKTPDILDFSPDSRYAFVTLRGPQPVSMPHMAQGETPGFAVIDVATRELVKLIQPAEGNLESDFHGIGVRVIH